MKGRKPVPAELLDPKSHKKGADNAEERTAAEARLKTTATLRCPNYLSQDAKAEWRRVMRLYRQMDANILCDLDLQALIMYCEATAIYKKAQETWTRYLQVLAANPDAQRALDKCFSIMEKQTAIVKGLSEQLCLTPVGRARMGVNAAKTKDESELEEFMNED